MRKRGVSKYSREKKIFKVDGVTLDLIRRTSGILGLSMGSEEEKRTLTMAEAMRRSRRVA